MKSLAKQNKTPKQLSTELKIHQNNISATLKELKDKGLVDVVNPAAKKGRYYRLTIAGKDMVENLEYIYLSIYY